MERLTIGAYWGPRKESSSACAARAMVMIDKLSHASPLLAVWLQGGLGKKQKIETVNSSQDFDRLFAASNLRQLNKIDESLRESVGFHLMLWNGQKNTEKISNLGIGCGKFGSELTNAVYLELPRELSSQTCEDVFGRDVLEALIDSWDPDWAAAYYHKTRHDPFLDRMLFVKNVSQLPRDFKESKVSARSYGSGLVYESI